MWRHAILLVVLAGCGTDPAAPGAGVDDTMAPSVVAGTVSVLPASASRLTSMPVTVSFQVDEELAEPPLLRLNYGGRPALALVDQDGQRWVYRYQTSGNGAEPVMGVDLLLTMRDLAQNLTTDLVIGSISFY